MCWKGSYNPSRIYITLKTCNTCKNQNKKKRIDKQTRGIWKEKKAKIWERKYAKRREENCLDEKKAWEDWRLEEE